MAAEDDIVKVIMEKAREVNRTLTLDECVVLIKKRYWRENQRDNNYENILQESHWRNKKKSLNNYKNYSSNIQPMDTYINNFNNSLNKGNNRISMNSSSNNYNGYIVNSNYSNDNDNTFNTWSGNSNQRNFRNYRRFNMNNDNNNNLNISNENYNNSNNNFYNFKKKENFNTKFK